ncbi:MAG: ubiquinone/menaquinone biosynthesis methyltransferase, partial [Planctomycetaceae bacterium]|nr:ubiquinone/menaquinone biosynthesis methyltransferase [Planctomycetaceae bacterium]
RRKTAQILLNETAPPGDILDVCCGTGDLTFAFQRRAVNRQFYGIDFSEKMIDIARRKLARTPLNRRLNFATCDALELPFEDERFAVVAVAFGLRNVGDTQRGLSEMVRVCKPGGTVGVLEFSMPVLPVVSQLYRFYFRRILPLVGKFFSRSKDDAYRYLPESVLEFDEPAALRQRLEQLGLTSIQSVPFTFGIATLTFGYLSSTTTNRFTPRTEEAIDSMRTTSP